MPSDSHLTNPPSSKKAIPFFTQAPLPSEKKVLKF